MKRRIDWHAHRPKNPALNGLLEGAGIAIIGASMLLVCATLIWALAR